MLENRVFLSDKVDTGSTYLPMFGLFQVLQSKSPLSHQLNQAS